MADDETPIHVNKNRFIRFSPTINSGHIFTIVSVIAGFAVSWSQMHSEVMRLTDENTDRKAEIRDTIKKSDNDRDELYKKIAENNAGIHQEIRELQGSLGARFDRLEDKMDRKADKAMIR